MARFEFREVQKFRQPWLWALILGTNAMVIGVFGYGLVQQLAKGEAWGNQPMSDVGLVSTFIVTVLVTLGLVWLFFAMALIVEVRSDGLSVHLKPLKHRLVEYRDIASVEACQYRPIVEYGGWGIRRGRDGWAYNVSGNQGVRLTFHEGKTLLIGSRRHVELARAIEQAREG